MAPKSDRGRGHTIAGAASVGIQGARDNCHVLRLHHTRLHSLLSPTVSNLSVVVYTAFFACVLAWKRLWVSGKNSQTMLHKQIGLNRKAGSDRHGLSLKIA